MGHNLDIPNKNEVQIINDFFEWNHKYRTGHYTISDKAYLLNEGSGYNDQGMDYSNVFDNVVKKGEVTVNDFITCLEDPAGSKLMYVSAHGGPQGHVWYDGSLRADKLVDLKKNSVFYILNSCSVCRWDQYVSSPNNPNYMGGLYVFDKTEENGDYGLGAIGFTGVGGFNWLEYFTDCINDNPNTIYGEAYKCYFNKTLMHIFGIWNNVYLGDPTIGPH